MHNTTNSTGDHFCCDPSQINVIIASGILGIILILVMLFWIIRNKFKYQPDRSMYQVI